MDLKQPFNAAPNVKVMINLGAGLDIPTGTYVQGSRGEWILNGGLAILTGIVGIGNLFKSTFMHFMFLTGMSRVYYESTGATFDTEVNIQEWHLKTMIARSLELFGEDVIDSGRWIITDKTMYSGNEWYKEQRDFLSNKVKNSNKFMITTPFLDRESKPFKMIAPTFSEIDSFTEFETDDVTEMQDKNELGESGGNTLHMRQGLAKLRFLMEAPRINTASSNYLLMTAHIGKETTMQNAGPGGSVPIVKLKHLKNGDKIKGVTDKFTFITHNCWQCFNATPLINQGTKASEYPKDSEDNTNLDTDLNTVHIRNLRSKSGISGMAQVLVVSQTEGVLPSLTEFHYIKEQGKYGLDGSNVSYWLDIYPDVKLSRTTVRSKIDNDPFLRRALNITSEMCQMNELYRTLEEGLLCTPKELYEDIKKLGYDWNILLNTRGWWTSIENEQSNKQIPNFLSTMDLLKMRQGKYHPFWLEEDKKTIKKEYQK